MIFGLPASVLISLDLAFKARFISLTPFLSTILVVVFSLAYAVVIKLSLYGELPNAKLGLLFFSALVLEMLLLFKPSTVLPLKVDLFSEV